jgi:hypothetical protein
MLQLNKLVRASVSLCGLLAVVAATACDSVLRSDERPVTNYLIEVTGTSPVPLSLITSTNFGAQRNTETNQVSVFPVTADTASLSLPYTRTVLFNGADRLFVRLHNRSVSETASIRLRVVIDGRERFNQAANMRDAFLDFTFFNFPF